MAVNLSVWSYWSAFIDGVKHSGKHGASDEPYTVPAEFSVDGNVHPFGGTLNDATLRALWDNDDDFPTAFKFLFFWHDGDKEDNTNAWLQFVGASLNYSIRIRPFVPFILGYDDMVIANNTTDLAADPTGETPDHINVWNANGDSIRYGGVIVD